MALLEVKNLGISFGGLRAVDEFSITIEKGQLYGLIGPNGAGKTTIFNMLTGVYKPTDGTIVLDGKNITGKSLIRSCGIRQHLCTLDIQTPLQTKRRLLKQQNGSRSLLRT